MNDISMQWDKDKLADMLDDAHAYRRQQVIKGWGCIIFMILVALGSLYTVGHFLIKYW